jgi:hypothetical protein
VLAEFGKLPFEHFAWGQALLYYNLVSTVTKTCILGKAWEAQLVMLVTGKKCWVGFVKKWLFKNQPQEVVGFLPPIQSPLQTMLQPATARVLQTKTTQPPLGTALWTTHIHPTPLAGVKGWAESQVLWCNMHNIRVGARMAELAML